MKCDIDIINRVKRMQGQINGILNMMEEKRSCDDLTMQLKAIETNIRRTITLLAVNNLIQKMQVTLDFKEEDFEEEIKLLVER